MVDLQKLDNDSIITQIKIVEVIKSNKEEYWNVNYDIDSLVTERYELNKLYLSFELDVIPLSYHKNIICDVKEAWA